MTDTIKEDMAAIVSRMPRYGKLIYKLYRDPEMSKKQKMILSAGLAYFVSPIDVIPGFIPVVGQLDDIIVALSALIRVLKKLPPEKRAVYLSNLDLTMEDLEGDLEASKKAAYYFMHKAASFTGKGVKAASKNVLKLTGKGVTKVGSGINFLLRKALSKK